jgi:hypothetical protein
MPRYALISLHSCAIFFSTFSLVLQVEAENKRLFIEKWEKINKNAGGLAKGGWTLGKLLGNVSNLH